MKLFLISFTLLFGEPAQAASELFRCELQSYYPNFDTEQAMVFDATLIVNEDLSGTVDIPRAQPPVELRETVIRTRRPYVPGRSQLTDTAIEKLGFKGLVSALEVLEFEQRHGQGDVDAYLIRLLDRTGKSLDTLAYVTGAKALGSCGLHKVLVSGKPHF